MLILRSCHHLLRNWLAIEWDALRSQLLGTEVTASLSPRHMMQLQAAGFSSQNDTLAAGVCSSGGGGGGGAASFRQQQQQGIRSQHIARQMPISPQLQKEILRHLPEQEGERSGQAGGGGDSCTASSPHQRAPAFPQREGSQSAAEPRHPLRQSFSDIALPGHPGARAAAAAQVADAAADQAPREAAASVHVSPSGGGSDGSGGGDQKPVPRASADLTRCIRGRSSCGDAPPAPSAPQPQLQRQSEDVPWEASVAGKCASPPQYGQTSKIPPGSGGSGGVGSARCFIASRFAVGAAVPTLPPVAASLPTPRQRRVSQRDGYVSGAHISVGVDGVGEGSIFSSITAALAEKSPSWYRRRVSNTGGDVGSGVDPRALVSSSASTGGATGAALTLTLGADDGPGHGREEGDEEDGALAAAAEGQAEVPDRVLLDVDSGELLDLPWVTGKWDEQGKGFRDAQEDLVPVPPLLRGMSAQIVANGTPTLVFKPAPALSPLSMLIETLSSSLHSAAAAARMAGGGAGSGGRGGLMLPPPPLQLPLASELHNPGSGNYGARTASSSVSLHQPFSSFGPGSMPYRSDLKALKLLEPLGRGGQGVVLRGCWGGLQAAVKCTLQPTTGDSSSTAASSVRSGPGPGTVAAGADPGMGKRLLLRCAWELAVTPTLSHPNIVQEGGGEGSDPGLGPAGAGLVYAVFTDVAILRVVEGICAPYLMSSAVSTRQPPGQLDTPTPHAGAVHLRLLHGNDLSLRTLTYGQKMPLYSVLCLEFCDVGTLLSASRKGAFVHQHQQQQQDVYRVSGVSLRSLLGFGDRPESAAVGGCSEAVALALRHLHGRRLVHGDLKPGNVLLKSNSRDPRGWTCKLSDFGCARLLSEAELAAGGIKQSHPSGTLPYMAPELLTAEGRQGFHSDVYAFGVMMWELLSGSQPYRGVDAATLPILVVRQGLRPIFDRQAPPDFVSLASQCWARVPASRPTAAQVVERLQVEMAGFIWVGRGRGRSWCEVCASGFERRGFADSSHRGCRCSHTPEHR
ncbi:hypothetical protein PLESTF_001420900 [Pleodorina starrii]|nr:hypothetical protein PLESTF_001420900 [Pleodorina starrii]